MSRATVVLTDLPGDRLANGFRRRLEHLVAHLAAHDGAVRVEPLFEDRARNLRDGVARAASVRPERFARRGDLVVLLSLGEVSMIKAADRFDRAGCDVLLDQCDSMTLQLLAAVRSRNVKDVLWALFRIMTAWRLPPSVGFSYISPRDERWDAVLNRRRAVQVISPDVDPALRALEPVDAAAIERVVVPADFASPHLVKGLDMLWSALERGVSTPVDLFGPAAPARLLAPNAHYRGFAADIGSVYRGDTVVFVANVGGPGVPNKLLEAMVAERPVIVHRSVRHRVPGALRGWTYRSSAEITRALKEIADGVAPVSI